MPIYNIWITVSSIIVAFAFVFGNSLRTVFEAVILMFVINPFDVGDCVTIDGSWFKVEEIGLLNTTLVRWDNAKLYYPNARLLTMPVHNISRSDTLWERVAVAIDCNVTQALISGIQS